jgi:hypothetical protein
MREYRPKDTVFAASFSAKDMSSIHELGRRIRETHDNSLIDDFNLKCQKKVDDHNPILEVGNQKIEFEQISKADDLVVNVGVDLFIYKILGTSVNRWFLMDASSGTTTPAVTDTVVTGPSTSTTMSLSGWRESASSSLRFGGIFGETEATLTVKESAVMASGGILLNRNMFSNNPITHTVNVQGFVISSVIEFVPVMS